MHSLIVGMTESGKSTLATLLCKAFVDAGIECIILDPMQDVRWAVKPFTDPASFLDYVKSKRSCMIFVDEGATSIGRYNSEMSWLATSSRHLGHSCWFISQRAQGMDATIRHQCVKVFMFACGELDSKTFAEEWREPRLKNLTKIQQWDFYIVSRFSDLQQGRVDREKGTVYYSTANSEGSKVTPDEKPS